MKDNAFVISFILLFLGFLSMSFLGIENKSVRVVSLLIIGIIVLLRKKRIESIIMRDPMVKSLWLFFLFSVPSIFFCEEVAKCGFKVFELSIMVMLTGLGVLYFKLGKCKYDVFQFICWYYVFQTVVTIIGYFFDPTAIAAERDYGNYVTFLHCNYPPIHGNSIGEFGGITLLFVLVLLHYKHQQGQIKLKNRIFLLIIGITGISVLYLSSSRTCMIAFAVALLFLISNLFKSDTKIKIMVIGMCFALAFSNEIIETTIRIMMKQQNEQTIARYDSTEDAIMSGRLSIWKTVLKNPEKLILGYGFGVASSENEIGAANAHNSMVEILINCGVFALLFWIRMWYLMYKRYRWLCKYSNCLPVDISWIHLGAAFAVQSIVRSLGNVSFVYFQLNSFSIIGTIILFSYCRFYILNKQV